MLRFTPDLSLGNLAVMLICFLLATMVTRAIRSTNHLLAEAVDLFKKHLRDHHGE